jgi:hypothetical protein
MMFASLPVSCCAVLITNAVLHCGGFLCCAVLVTCAVLCWSPMLCCSVQVKMAHALGGDVRLGAPGEHVTLDLAEQRAQAYVSAAPRHRFLSPFGLRTERGDPVFELFRGALLEALCFVQAPPKR